MARELSCISCKKNVANSTGTVSFNCPKCKEKITRCGNCRALSTRYTCKCSFTGPN